MTRSSAMEMEREHRERRGTRRAAPRPLLLGALAFALVAALGCRGGDGRTYTVRGQVVQVPEAGNPASSFQVYHEAIDGFVGRDGQITGMDPMTMPFPLAKGVSLEDVKIGDPVEFTLEVDWNAEPPVKVTKLSELPAGTKLEYRAADPDRAR